MTDFKVQTDFDVFRKAIAHVPTDAKKQYAFAISKMGRMAKDAGRADFDENFIMRSKFMQGSIVSTNANPNKLQSTVGTINHLLSLHMFGGKKPGNVAVKGFRGDDKKGKVPRSQTAAKIEAKMGTAKSHQFFKKDVKGRTYIFAKMGGTVQRQRRRNGYTGAVFAREPIVPLWLLRDGQSITIKPDWRFEKVVTEMLHEKGPAILAEVIEDAWNHAVEKGRVPFRF